MKLSMLFMRVLLCVFLSFSLGLRVRAQGQAEENSPKSIGMRALNNGELPTARENLEKAYRQDDKDTLVILSLAETCIRQQDGKRAEQVLEKGLILAPESGLLNLKMGLAQNLRSKFKKAQEYFSKANENLSLDHPDRSTLYINLGLAIMSDNRAVDALPWFDKALELNPRNVTAYSYRGASLYHVGDFTDAIEAFTVAIDLDSKNDITIYNRGMAYLKQGDQKAACQDFHRSCQMGNMNACKIIMVECAQN